MVVETEELLPKGYGFLVYNPPVPGLPWLAVCLGPNGRVLGAETFDTEEGAQRRVTELADDFKASRDTAKTHH